MNVQQMMSSHPSQPHHADEALLRCIESLYSCAQTCTACADACLATSAVADLRRCIRLSLDCADLCIAAGRCLTRATDRNEPLLAEILNSCALVCHLCGVECARHARRHAHCRICAAACRDCQIACNEAIRSLRGLA